MYKKRSLTFRLLELASVFPAVVIVGARQVGKSTLIKHVFGGKADYVVFDPVIDMENARQDPELFLRNHKTPLILDEIQYVPEVVACVKRKIDQDRKPGQYFLTGSQQWGVMKSMAESLAGRAVFLDLEGFSLAEIAEEVETQSWLEQWLTDPQKFISIARKAGHSKTPLSEQLFRGFFPEAQSIPLQLIPDFYEGYLRTYLERDVRFLADLRDLQTFSRFIRLVAALSAQEMNFSTLGRELGLTPQTSKHWLQLLESSFQWTSAPAFSGNIIKRVSLKSKGYFADTGLLCHAQAISSPQVLAGHPLWGAIFETAVTAEIRKMSKAMTSRPNIYHWRRYSGSEVDLILERDGTFYPLEIKASSRLSRADARGISAFREQYKHLKIAKGLIIAPVEKSFPLTDEDYAFPWDSAKNTLEA